MLVNGQPRSRFERNIASVDERIYACTRKLKAALALRDLKAIKSQSNEIRRLRERRDRWVAAMLEVRCDGLSLTTAT